MDKIIGNSSTGKTERLLQLAKSNNGILVCKNAESMRMKAYVYGITHPSDIEFVSYADYFISTTKNEFNPNNKPVYIDNMEDFLKSYDINIQGYSEASDD